MARLARVVVPGLPHHVTQRGNRRLPTFFGQEALSAEALDVLRRHERTGRPLGSEAFVSCLEQQLGRVLQPQKPGRPRRGE